MGWDGMGYDVCVRVRVCGRVLGRQACKVGVRQDEGACRLPQAMDIL